MIKETHKFKVSIPDSNYYLVEIKENVHFKIDDLKQLVELEKEISGKKLPVLVLCLPDSHTESNTLKYIAKNQNNPYSIADAFVIYSLAQKILANTYLKFHHSERPVKFFNNKEEALHWLQQFMNKSNMKTNEVEVL